MSIELMNRLWWRDFSEQLAQLGDDFPGSDQPFHWTLVALADFANERDCAWPSIAALAFKARVSERSAQRALRQAEAIGIIRRCPRPNRSAVYVFVRDMLPKKPAPEHEADLQSDEQPDMFDIGISGIDAGTSGGASEDSGGASGDLRGAPVAPRTTNDSSIEEPPSRTLTHAREEIDQMGFDMFAKAWSLLCTRHDRIPCPRFGDKPDILGPNRSKKMRARLREFVPDPTPENMAAFLQDLFDRIAASAFLCGKEKSWSINVDWVLEPRNMTKVLEGNYDRKLAGAAGANGLGGSTTAQAVDLALERMGLADVE